MKLNLSSIEYIANSHRNSKTGAYTSTIHIILFPNTNCGLRMKSFTGILGKIMLKKLLKIQEFENSMRYIIKIIKDCKFVY